MAPLTLTVQPRLVLRHAEARLILCHVCRIQKHIVNVF